KPHKGYAEGDEEERNPDIVEYHSILCISFYSYLYISSICKITLLYRKTASKNVGNTKNEKSGRTVRPILPLLLEAYL
ncbi:MAG: hypothetical protein PUK42_06400, partial [Prevotellaceae bacterium]|nr:hypothetical protein [Prevotellaceae bacterium]